MRANASRNLFVCALSVVVTLSAAAFGQPRARPEAAPVGFERMAAEQLFEEALRLMETGQFAKACTKLERSQRLDPGVGTLLYLGHCLKSLGRTASAWAAFSQAEAEAREAKQPDRERAAADAAAALLPELANVKIVAATPLAAGLVIELDGVPIGNELLEVPLPIDPGKHIVSMRAPGKKPHEQTVRIAAKPVTTTVALPTLSEIPRRPPPPKPKPVVVERPWQRWGWFFAGVGLAALGGGLTTFATDGDAAAGAALTGVAGASFVCSGVMLFVVPETASPSAAAVPLTPVIGVRRVF